MQEEDFLSRCVVDPVARKFYLYSEQGEERVVDCETIDQFMSVLEPVSYTHLTLPTIYSV